jgi:DNA topoisomerase-1
MAIVEADTAEKEEEPKKVKKPRSARSTKKKSVDGEKGGGGEGALVIVESPTKARTITKYLGKGFRVMASVGHIRDLPKSRLGIDLDHDFTPEYIVIKGKTKIVSEIKKAAKAANRVYLAPDPDREGEAIAWHIAQELGSDNLSRVYMHEITEKGVREAMAAPMAIDIKKVDAQQARRVLDRIVGYKISPLLWQKVQRGLSAGRVQSVAVRIICEREKEVLAFVREEYWSIDAKVSAQQPPAFSARLLERGGEAIAIPDQATSDAILRDLAGLPFVISSVITKERRKNPAPPFTTSSLQQEAVRKLGFTSKRTMAIAQQLYEGVTVTGEGAVGLITYMRTDSVRVSPDFQRETADWIQETYGPDYRPQTPPVYRSKKLAQEAHEAIRPTGVMRVPDRIQSNLTHEQYLLYKLIWNRFLSSQMNPAILDVTRIDIAAGDFLFRSTGSVVKFDGFTVLYLEKKEGKAEEEEEGLDGEKRLPRVSVGEALTCSAFDPKQHFTEPPPRYNEALLIHDLEEQGIGRPSTYAAIISTIQDRKYVEKLENRFHPTDMGNMVNDLLMAHFSEVVDIEFTARMEEGLDRVEEGEQNWVETVRQFYAPFSQSLERAMEKMPNIKRQEIPTDEVCEKCTKPMVIKFGRFGQFMACTGYPECKNTKEIAKGEKSAGGDAATPVEITSEACEKCGKPMKIKVGRFGRFMACTGYPDCESTKPISTGVSCPEENCGGALVEKKTKRGKNFYSCSHYPTCKFAIWDRPVARPCPVCHAPFLIEKNRSGQFTVACQKKECGYKEVKEG